MNIGIVGGGMLGMTVAWRAALAGHRVTIWESSSRCGGLAEPWTIGNVTWDRHYHVIVRQDRALLSLLRELNLSDDITWVSAKTGFYIDGTMYPFTSVSDFLRFAPLSPWQKMRLAATILRAQQTKDWRSLERITAV
ncbi:MAG TPA: FAD-dependent oxidoreductase, partial [Candidatus Aquilonibacter sp.]|nr:FAD-dependent oxidoreductase [Candidatus Aquilonibacter sp.]